MEKTKMLESSVSKILALLGENPSRHGLEKTPFRVAESILFLTEGYQKNLAAVVNGAIFEDSSKKMIIVRDISFYSLCEHHLLPFFGKIHIAYIPNGRIIGLSKIPRIIEMFSKRIQLQERLTKQVAESIQKVLQPKGIIVLAEAQHFCVMMRGVQKQDISVVTHWEKGVFLRNRSKRNDFFSLVANKKI